MRRILIISQIFLLVVVFICSGESRVAIRLNPSGEKVLIPVLETRGTMQFVPLSVVCQQLGYNCQWDRYSQRLVCTQKQSKVVFVQDNSFYSVNGKIYQCSMNPVRISGTLCLPINIIVNGLKPFLKGAFQIDSQKISAESISDNKYSIQSVNIEKKQNGTLVTVKLSDSIPYDCTYFYPNLTINFLNGTIDTHAIHQLQRVGLIDSMFSLQYKQSAQISLILNREIQEPLLDYIQDTHTLLIAIRQKKVKAAISNVKKTPVESVATQGKNSSDEGIKTIVLDPGHGGKDPGAIGYSGVREKDVVLAIALNVRDLLKKESGIKVLLTRETDVFIPLSDRTKYANDKNADLFLSVHADAVPGNVKRKENAKGYKIYFLSQAKNDEDKLVAMRENAVIQLEERPQNYGNLQNVLIDLAGNEYLRESQDLCIFLDKQFETSLNKKITKLQLGIGQANFWVLNGAYMPSVLIETGFLSNPSEEKLLSDKKFQSEMASSIYKAILGFKKKFENGL